MLLNEVVNKRLLQTFFIRFNQYLWENVLIVTFIKYFLNKRMRIPIENVDYAIYESTSIKSSR